MRVIIGKGFEGGVALCALVKADDLKALPVMAGFHVEDYGGIFSRILLPCEATDDIVLKVIEAILNLVHQEKVTARLEIEPERVHSLIEWADAFRWLQGT